MYIVVHVDHAQVVGQVAHPGPHEEQPVNTHADVRHATNKLCVCVS